MADTKKILFIEDEKEVVEAFAERFKQHNVEVISAGDGQEGLKLAEEQKPDLILLDLILPKMHGFEFLEKLRSDESLKDTPVIVLSNLGGELNVTKAKDLGVKDYLVKTETKVDQTVEKIVNQL